MVEDIEALAESEFAVIAKTSLQACPNVSKLLVAYLKDLLAVAPYRRGIADPRAKVFTQEVARHSTSSRRHMAFLKRKLRNGTVGIQKGWARQPEQHGGRTTTSRQHWSRQRSRSSRPLRKQRMAQWCKQLDSQIKHGLNVSRADFAIETAGSTNQNSARMYHVCHDVHHDIIEILHT
jgi:hypothetical protein